LAPPHPTVLPTAEPFGPGSAVVLFGLASAAAWGAGDFGGGWASRRAPVLGVSLAVQALGVALAAGLALVSGEAALEPGSIAIAVAAGAVVVVGILGLYQGLAVGRMGVVAPVTGVIAATLPVVAGIAMAGPPAASVLVGIVLALVAVVLVSRVKGEDGRRSGIEFAIAAGVGIGVFNILVALLPGNQVFGPLFVIKLAAAAVIVAIVVVGRSAWRVPRATLPIVLAVGVFDMCGNALYLLATQVGRLDVAATLSSLYPVTTILLAVALLGERVTRFHAVGIAAAVTAVVLIGVGSGGA
jgi:drug/metabolite transporter (DMT)-like permease